MLTLPPSNITQPSHPLTHPLQFHPPLLNETAAADASSAGWGLLGSDMNSKLAVVGGGLFSLIAAALCVYFCCCGEKKNKAAQVGVAAGALAPLDTKGPRNELQAWDDAPAQRSPTSVQMTGPAVVADQVWTTAPLLDDSSAPGSFNINIHGLSNLSLKGPSAASSGGRRGVAASDAAAAAIGAAGYAGPAVDAGNYRPASSSNPLWS